MFVMRLMDVMEYDFQKKKGRYLCKFNPEANDGRGYIETTRLLEKAMKFDTIDDLFETWKTQSRTVPFRPDGKPNRPLTAYTMSPELLVDLKNA